MPYTCPVCDRTSSHPEDERNRYCGRCHRFNGDWSPEIIKMLRLMHWGSTADPFELRVSRRFVAEMRAVGGLEPALLARLEALVDDANPPTMLGSQLAALLEVSRRPQPG